MDEPIHHLRVNYRRDILVENQLPNEPIALFQEWFKDALAEGVREPNAMQLATVNAQGRPNVRTVLLKELDRTGFVFFTNYLSNKGVEMQQNPFVALNFLWLTLERQVRISGTVEKISAEESDAYFTVRPIGSRLGAWASPQSQVITREDLEAKMQEFTDQYGESEDVPRPDHWGGYRVIPDYIEFWQGRPNRLHDRIAYTLDSSTNSWDMARLAP